jgi:hypothetical protein
MVKDSVQSVSIWADVCSCVQGAGQNVGWTGCHMFPVLVRASKELVRMTKCWPAVLMYPVPFSSVQEPELQGAETFCWSWSHNKVLAPAPYRL